MHRAWVPAVDVSVIGAEGGHLKLKAVFQHDDYTEMRTDRVRAREKRLHGFRARISGDVVILRCQTSDHVAHATACEVRDVPLLPQVRRDFTRALFHGRKVHRTRGRGGSPEPPTQHAMTITERAIEVNHPYLPIVRHWPSLSETSE